MLAVQINPLILRRPQDFKAVIERLEQWPIIPSESELYHQPVYGRLKLVKSQWIAEAKMIKQASLKELLTLQSLINNPEYYQALIFVQDYIDQKIENTPANNDQYLLYVEQLERFNKNAHF